MAPGGSASGQNSIYASCRPAEVFEAHAVVGVQVDAGVQGEAVDEGGALLGQRRICRLLRQSAHGVRVFEVQCFRRGVGARAQGARAAACKVFVQTPFCNSEARRDPLPLRVRRRVTDQRAAENPPRLESGVAVGQVDFAGPPWRRTIVRTRQFAGPRPKTADPAYICFGADTVFNVLR
jgi:hypothetical protein